MTFPATIKPMLATSAGKPFDSSDWLFEIKHDGYRIVAYISKDNVRLKTRKNVDYTSKFQVITNALKKWKVEAVIDGEIVVLNDEGVSDFHALQNYKSGDALYYYAFDLLHLNGRDYTGEPLGKRKALLKKILPKSEAIRYTDHIVGRGIELFQLAEKLGLEGLMAKRMNSAYRPGTRTKDWLKIKAMKECMFTIAGLTYSASGLSSLILATEEKGGFYYAGDVGTGFDAKEAKEIISTIKAVKKCPLVKEPTFGKGRWGRKVPAKVIWCRPVLRCRVKYLERTEAGELRHASFKGLI
jgi:bifunctional non-homologous end joining protein LigD